MRTLDSTDITSMLLVCYGKLIEFFSILYQCLCTHTYAYAYMHMYVCMCLCSWYWIKKALSRLIFFPCAKFSASIVGIISSQKRFYLQYTYDSLWFAFQHLSWSEMTQFLIFL